MTVQRNLPQKFNFTANTLEEAQKYATIIANSGICPESFRGRPNDVLIVLQLGSELGLKPMQSLRSLGSINGIPFAYGDGLLALVKRHSEFEDMKEWFEGELEKNTLTACCTMKRVNMEPVTQRFSMEDARRAGLWGKTGVWTKYPRRMLQHRARGYAARDAFPDALYGLRSEEEAISIAESAKIVEMPKPNGKGVKGLEESLGIAQDEPTIIDAEVMAEAEATPAPSKLDELKALIADRKVTKGAVTVTLKKFGVTAIDELSEEAIDKWSTHLKNKESK